MEKEDGVFIDTSEEERTGKDKMLCPYHIENTPSMMVHYDKGIFHCFGCGAAGKIVRTARKKVIFL